MLQSDLKSRCLVVLAYFNTCFIIVLIIWTHLKALLCVYWGPLVSPGLLFECPHFWLKSYVYNTIRLYDTKQYIPNTAEKKLE